MTKWDHVIVGAGSAGAVLAARLSEDSGRTVLVLEAGPDYARLDVTPDDLLYTQLSFYHDWGWTADACAGRSIPYPRGKVTGGSSAVNGSIALRGDPDDFAEWAARGLLDWSWDRVLPYFCMLEDDPQGAEIAPDVHGVGGPVPIRRVAEHQWHSLHVAFHSACVAAGFPQCPDLNAPGATGVGAAPKNRVDGVRMSTALTYLASSRGRPNLEIRANTLVDSVIVKGARARGVNVIVDGKAEQVEAAEVVLAAGAVASPAILLRSGIGPKADLRALGIPVVVDRPGVGATLLDHPLAALTGSPQPGTSSDEAFNPAYLRYTATSSSEERDVQLSLVTIFDLAALGGLPGLTTESLPMFMMAAILMKPYSAGRLTITSTDPAAQPYLELGFLKDPFDRTRLIEALRLARDLCRTRELREFVAGLHLGDDVLDDDAAIDGVLTQQINTTYHPVGTCPMGEDDDDRAVVDSHGRLYGIEGLRVVDASIMPTIVRNNPNLTCIMLAEKIAAAMGAEG
jgi:choline dehydrogenase